MTVGQSAATSVGSSDGILVGKLVGKLVELMVEPRVEKMACLLAARRVGTKAEQSVATRVDSKA